MSLLLKTPKATSFNHAVETMAELMKAVLHDREFPEDYGGGAVVRLEVKLPSISVVDWLSKQTGQIRLYWCDREGAFEMAGVGAADTHKAESGSEYRRIFAEIGKTLRTSGSGIRYYGGLKFDSESQAEDCWSTFGAAQFVLPRFEIFVSDDTTVLASNLLIEKDARQFESLLTLLHQLRTPQPGPSKDYDTAVIQQRDLPERPEWDEILKAALLDIRADVYKKIVLARQRELTFTRKPEPLSLLVKIKNSNTRVYQFAFAPGDSHAFVVASPEQLYKRLESSLQCEAVAGTRPRGSNLKEDARLAKELLSNDKDLREHQYVVSSLEEALGAYGSVHSTDSNDSPKILQLARLQHLVRHFEMTLERPCDDFQLLEALHPTAAVGGYPRQEACQAIRALEPFDRGWYGAPVGWLSSDGAEFAVGIRCGLISNDKLYLYSGAGVVEGSTAEGEWAEIENKLSSIQKALM